MKKKGMTGFIMILAIVSFQAFPAYADSDSGIGGSVSARLGFSVRVSERISLKTQENNGGGEIKVAALVGPNATVNLNGNGDSADRGLMRKTGGGLYEGTVVQGNDKAVVYTVASP